MIFIVFVDVVNFVFVDESGVNQAYQRESARAKRGVKIHGLKSGRKGKRTNVVAGLINGRHAALRCYTHTTNSAFFEEWFEWELISAIPEKTVVIMDNACFHRKNQLYRIAERYSVFILFLPKYSPDFNPIEKSWANLKRWLVDNLKRFFSLDFAIEHYFGTF